jgi:hypothetical protein
MFSNTDREITSPYTGIFKMFLEKYFNFTEEAKCYCKSFYSICFMKVVLFEKILMKKYWQTSVT